MILDVDCDLVVPVDRESDPAVVGRHPGFEVWVEGRWTSLAVFLDSYPAPVRVDIQHRYLNAPGRV